VAVGYLVRGSGATESAMQTSSASGGSSFGGSNAVQPSRLELTAPIVGPLLEQLKTRPNDADLLVKIGNAYYDGKDYPNAIGYYQRALKLRPDNVNVRTDMATAMWYSGDADGAIQQYEVSLKYEPTHSQTLFNMGIVRWQGKKDAKGALQVWEKLLASNPGYADRPKVQQLIDQVKLETGSGS
jgi:cytochrome c-type biogenesis protein CcmH/NrfG